MTAPLVIASHEDLLRAVQLLMGVEVAPCEDAMEAVGKLIRQRHVDYRLHIDTGAWPRTITIAAMRNFAYDAPAGFSCSYTIALPFTADYFLSVLQQVEALAVAQRDFFGDIGALGWSDAHPDEDHVLPCPSPNPHLTNGPCPCLPVQSYVISRPIEVQASSVEDAVRQFCTITALACVADPVPLEIVLPDGSQLKTTRATWTPREEAGDGAQ